MMPGTRLLHIPFLANSLQRVVNNIPWQASVPAFPSRF